MPVFGLGKQRFDPALALVHGFLIGEGLVVPLHTFQAACVKRTVQLPTLVAGSTLRFEWTGIACGCIRPLLHASRALYSIRNRPQAIRRMERSRTSKALKTHTSEPTFPYRTGST